jgi:hypothetical protein
MMLTQHPLSAAFPSMSPQELSDLTDDIALHGLIHPVVTLDGQVLDGWHRYQACLHAEAKPITVEFDGPDPVAFVLGANIQRRHLTATQRAAAIVLANAWKPSGKQGGGEAASPPLSNAEMAAQAKTTVRTIQHAKRGVEAGKGKAMRDGEISAEAAAKPKDSAATPKGPQGDEVDVPEDRENDDSSERMADIVADYEAAAKIIESDDKLSEAWSEVKALSQRLADMTRLYEAKCAELATMTKEAKRHQRRADALEAKKGGA